MREQVVDMIVKSTGKDVEIKSDDMNLINVGFLDSLSMMQLIDEIENFYHIEVDGEDIIPENFDTVNHIIETVSRYINE